MTLNNKILRFTLHIAFDSLMFDCTLYSPVIFVYRFFNMVVAIRCIFVRYTFLVVRASDFDSQGRGFKPTRGIKHHRSTQLADVSENPCPGQPKPCEEIREDGRKSSSVDQPGQSRKTS